MDFAFSDEQQAIRDAARRFASEHLAPSYRKREAEGMIGTAVTLGMGELGLIGTDLPEEYGGLGLDCVTTGIIIEEIAAADLNVSYVQLMGSLNGKILRLTLDGKPAPGNPFDNEVWSWGHRNPQGLVFHPNTGALYSAEHGPRTDDEVNLIERERNYGWPTVNGRCDTPEEREFCRAYNVVEPVAEWTPTVGMSGADIYVHDLIPGWKGNILVTSLRGRSLFRVTLGPDGRRATSIERLFEDRYGRLRDVLVGPDGFIYIATSNHDGRARAVGPFAGDDKVLKIGPAS